MGYRSHFVCVCAGWEKKKFQCVLYMHGTPKTGKTYKQTKRIFMATSGYILSTESASLSRSHFTIYIYIENGRHSNVHRQVQGVFVSYFFSPIF